MSDPTATTEAPAADTSLSAVSTMLGGDAAPAPAAPQVEGQPAPTAEAPKDGEHQPEALTMPGKDATPEQWAEFYGKIGRPETPDAYEMELPEGDDGTFAKAVAPLLHKTGITSEQAKQLSQGWNQMRSEAEATMAQQAADAAQAAHVQNTAEAATLKSEWGQQFDANMHHAKLAVQQFLPKDKAADTISALESKLGYKATIEFLHNIGKGLGEHDAAGMGSNNAGTPAKSLADRLYGG